MHLQKQGKWQNVERRIFWNALNFYFLYFFVTDWKTEQNRMKLWQNCRKTIAESIQIKIIVTGNEQISSFVFPNSRINCSWDIMETFIHPYRPKPNLQKVLYSTVCINWCKKKLIFLDMKFVQKVCVFGTMSKRNNCSLYYFKSYHLL